eukprot:COSAG02_NODE_3978_length_5960_cov_5.861116_6_plen_87_part_00
MAARVWSLCVLLLRAFACRARASAASATGAAGVRSGISTSADYMLRDVRHIHIITCKSRCILRSELLDCFSGMDSKIMLKLTFGLP